MLHQIPTNSKKCTLEVKIKTKQERPIFIVGFDPTVDNTFFFKRLMYVNGLQTFFFGLPQSPKNLQVIIYDNETRNFSQPDTYELVSIKKLPIKTASTGAGWLTREYITFAQEFSLKLATLKGDQSYADKNNRFRIDLFEQGLDFPTPARIEKVHDYIEVSKPDFLEMTIPRRMVILLHEYAHNFLNKNQDSEVEADINAMRIYLGLGYPFMEGIYAFTYILHDTDMSMERLNEIKAYMQKHNLFIGD